MYWKDFLLPPQGIPGIPGNQGAKGQKVLLIVQNTVKTCAYKHLFQSKGSVCAQRSVFIGRI